MAGRRSPQGTGTEQTPARGEAGVVTEQAERRGPHASSWQPRA
ncbi:hypothetical protein SGL43_01736 [Streptomyces globisporus]|uniref:Uncharacterized protein n=1 Tax=Streptomyces globisporus TaxID=1908 RepID=A0ABM9GTB0_STRGL|nr:hypothetical protein SGL43_01736 [Streptomyces globisporus]